MSPFLCLYVDSTGLYGETSYGVDFVLSRKPFLPGVVLLVLVLLVASCTASAQPAGECVAPRDGQLVAVPCTAAGTPEPTPPPTTVPSGDGGTIVPSTGGLEVFLREGTCFICHTISSVPQARGQIGPDLSKIGQKGEAHIRQSIMDPNAVMADPCPTGPCAADTMPQNFAQTLTPAQLDALVAYLVTLK